MPGGDRTGPMGGGPLTGGGFGFCAPSPGRGVSRYGIGGRQGGFGRGRGWRNRFWATGRTGWMRMSGRDERFGSWSAASERQNLEREATVLEAELKRLRALIGELESPSSE
jgi:hypothetical protein